MTSVVAQRHVAWERQAIAAFLLTMALVTPVLGGALQCAVLATVGGGSATEVETGEEVLIEGTGFPFNASVEITYSVDGTPIGSETLMSDATGMFETSVTPQPGEEGTWTVTADVAKACTAETGFLVVHRPDPCADAITDADRDPGSDAGVRRAAGCGGEHAGWPECGCPRRPRRSVLRCLALTAETGTPRALTGWCPPIK